MRPDQHRAGPEQAGPRQHIDNLVVTAKMGSAA